MKRIQVLISSSQRLFRESLERIFGRERQIDILKARPDVPPAQAALSLTPDIVILETKISDHNAVETAQKILSADTSIQIIALSDSIVPQHIWRMINLGVSGYLLKSSSLKQLLTAIEFVANGEIYLSPEVAGMVAQRSSARQKRSSLFLLSGREMEILQLLAEGYKIKNIAKKLYISQKTVQAHQSNLKKKLNLFTTAELTQYALKNCITTLDIHRGPHSPQ